MFVLYVPHVERIEENRGIYDSESPMFYHMLARVPRGLRSKQTTIIHSRCPVTGEFLDGDAKRVAFQLTDEKGQDVEQTSFESVLMPNEITFIGCAMLRIMA